HVRLSSEDRPRGDRGARARDAREGRDPPRRHRSDRAAPRAGHALPPHAAVAGLRARLADHGMKWLAVVAVLGGAARADTPATPVMRPEAIEIDRDTTPPGQAELSFDGGAPIGTWAAGVTLGYLERPLELHTLASSAYPIDRRETAVVGGAVSLGDRLIVDAR